MNNEEIEAKVRESFEKASSKSIKLAKQVLLGVLGVFGAFLLISGIIFTALKLVDETGFSFGIVFIAVGSFLLILGLILYFCLPKKLNYDIYKKRYEKFGTYNVYYLSAKLIEEEERIKYLEEKIEELEKKIISPSIDDYH